jgi:hypothetical protein
MERVLDQAGKLGAVQMTADVRLHRKVQGGRSGKLDAADHVH